LGNKRRFSERESIRELVSLPGVFPKEMNDVKRKLKQIIK
jgi:hypothetical protein